MGSRPAPYVERSFRQNSSTVTRIHGTVVALIARHVLGHGTRTMRDGTWLLSRHTRRPTVRFIVRRLRRAPRSIGSIIPIECAQLMLHGASGMFRLSWRTIGVARVGWMRPRLSSSLWISLPRSSLIGVTAAGCAVVRQRRLIM